MDPCSLLHQSALCLVFSCTQRSTVSVINLQWSTFGSTCVTVDVIVLWQSPDTWKENFQSDCLSCELLLNK